MKERLGCILDLDLTSLTWSLGTEDGLPLRPYRYYPCPRGSGFWVLLRMTAKGQACVCNFDIRSARTLVQTEDVVQHPTQRPWRSLAASDLDIASIILDMTFFSPWSQVEVKVKVYKVPLTKFFRGGCLPTSTLSSLLGNFAAKVQILLEDSLSGGSFGCALKSMTRMSNAYEQR